MSEFPILITPKHYSKTERIYKEDPPTSNKNYIYKFFDQNTGQKINECDEGSINLEIELGESSSSSLSWSDEYESEVTKKVSEKLKRLDRVLKGQEEFPPHYDREEFEQWMNTFPNISIFDPMPSGNNNKDPLVFGSNSSRQRDKNNTVHHQKEPSVINSFELTYNRSITERSANNLKKHIDNFNTRNKNIFTLSSKFSLDTEKSLKITPIKKLADRKLSTKSLNVHRVSKEYLEFPAQFDSLPFIEIDEICSGKRKPSSTFRKRKYLNSTSNFGKNTDVLILPPIHADKLRSISATPGQDKPSRLFLI